MAAGLLHPDPGPCALRAELCLPLLVRAAALGVTPRALDNTSNDAFGQRWVRLLFLPHNWAQVVLEVGAAKDANPSTLDRVFVPSVGGGQIPLSAVTRPMRSYAPMWIWHDG